MSLGCDRYCHAKTNYRNCHCRYTDPDRSIPGVCPTWCSPCPRNRIQTFPYRQDRWMRVALDRRHCSYDTAANPTRIPTEKAEAEEATDPIRKGLAASLLAAKGCVSISSCSHWSLISELPVSDLLKVYQTRGRFAKKAKKRDCPDVCREQSLPVIRKRRIALSRQKTIQAGPSLPNKGENRLTMRKSNHVSTIIGSHNGATPEKKTLDIELWFTHPAIACGDLWISRPIGPSSALGLVRGETRGNLSLTS